MRKDETPVDFAKKQGSIWEKTAQKEHFDAPEKSKSTLYSIIDSNLLFPRNQWNVSAYSTRQSGSICDQKNSLQTA